MSCTKHDEASLQELALIHSQELEADEDDFLSGVTCNPDAPEECESCQ